MVPSPCINICQMDATNGLCLGCWRTLVEITDWSRLDDMAKIDIRAAVARRRQEYDSRKDESRCNSHENE